MRAGNPGLNGIGVAATRVAGHEINRRVVRDSGVVAEERNGVQVTVTRCVDTFYVIVLDRDAGSIGIDPVLPGSPDVEVLHRNPAAFDSNRPHGVALAVINLWAALRTTGGDGHGRR